LRIKFGLDYSSRWAYVDSIIHRENASSKEILEQTMGSWKTFAVLRFCFHGRVIGIQVGDFLSVEGDGLDAEFLRLAKILPAREHGFWRQVYEMLKAGRDKTDILEFMQTYAIARGLRK